MRAVLPNLPNPPVYGPELCLCTDLGTDALAPLPKGYQNLPNVIT